MAEAGERLAGATQQRVVVHTRQGDALATFARQGVVAQHHQRLVGGQPRQRQREDHAAERIQAPGGAAEEAVDDRDVARCHGTGGQRYAREGAASLALDPANDQPVKDHHAPRLETRREGAQQDRQRRG
jgi:hypothetical protein